MSKLHICNLNVTVEINPVTSLLNALLQNGINLPHQCGGKAQCGTCRIIIKKGMEFLNPPTALELERLHATRVGGKIRLACQTHMVGNVEIEIPRSKAKDP